jgi:hypothetical protein
MDAHWALRSYSSNQHLSAIRNEPGSLQNAILSK